MAWSMRKKPWLYVRYTNPDKDCFKVTRDFLREAAIDCTEEMVTDAHYKIFETDPTLEPQIDYYILFQYFYNAKTNKSFIQYCAHNHGQYWDLDTHQLQERITRRIQSQFYYDTGIFAEIMNYDVADVVPDNRRTITPYTIGYWRALEGHYETIEDRAEVHHDCHNTFLPPDVAEHKISDFFPIAADIARRYKLLENAVLSREDQQEYIRRHYELLAETHGKGDYPERLEELNEEFTPGVYYNQNIPDAYEEYWTAYRDMFGAELPRIENLARKLTISIRHNNF